MESAYANLERKGATLYSDRAMRLRERPQATGFEDLGSDFVRGKSGEAGKGVRGGGNTRSGRNSRGGSVEMVAVKKPKLTPLEDDSDDELNIISAGPSKAGSSNKKLTSEGSLDSTGFNADGTMIDGQFYPWDEDTIRIQEHSTNLKGLKFKKNSRSTETSAANSTSATSPSTRHSSLARSSRTATKAASAPFKPPTVTRSSGGQRSALGSSSKLTQDHEKQKGRPEDETAAPRPNARPKARPAYKASEPESQRSTRQSKKDIAPFPMQDLSPLKETSNAPSKGKSRGWGSSSDDESDGPGSGKGKGKAKIRDFPMQYSPIKPKEAQPFPLSPPRKSQPARGRSSQDSQLEPDSSPLSSPESVQERFPATAPTVPSKPLAAFPVLSPLSSPIRPQGSKKLAAFPVLSPISATVQPNLKEIKKLPPFPVLSPNSSPVRPKESKKQSETRAADQPSQGRPKRRAAMASRRVVDTESDEGSEEEIPRPPPRRKKKKPDIKPFPMETQMLESIDRAEYGSLDGIQIVSSDEEEMTYDRRVRGGEEILREIMRSEDMSGSDEEMFMDPGVDPSSLCPWCDERLPPTPSPLLQKLIAVARSKSWNDPRMSNPHGLHAPATVFVNVCHRHQFEQHHFPLAQQRGWPTVIEWDKLSGRVISLKPKLQAIVGDVDEDFAPGRERPREDRDKDTDTEDEEDAEDDDFLIDYRPRKGSLFWLEVVKNVKKRGASNAAGVRAQMSNFSKTQPGYYGELGAVILAQTLYDMFPPLHFPPNSTSPLSPADFVQSILLPETAVSLIMEDMQLSRKEAITTMRESAQYGVAMFPDDNAQGYSAGEVVVKKRADARRRQLELEEQGGQPSSSRTFERRSPERRNTARKATSRNYAESDDDEDVRMVSDSSHADAFKAKKPRSKRVPKPASTNKPPSVIDVSDAPSSSLPNKPRPKPRPKAKEGFSSEVEAEEHGDTELLYPASSDVEPSADNHNRPPPTIKFGAKGLVLQVDVDATPKPLKRMKVKEKVKDGLSRSSSLSSFASHIQPTGTSVASSSKITSESHNDDRDRWTRNLRGDIESDEEL